MLAAAGVLLTLTCRCNCLAPPPPAFPPAAMLCCMLPPPPPLRLHSVQYLQQPERVFAEVYRVLRPGGVAIFTFSNRMFYGKVRFATPRAFGTFWTPCTFQLCITVVMPVDVACLGAGSAFVGQVPMVWGRSHMHTQPVSDQH